MTQIQIARKEDWEAFVNFLKTQPEEELHILFRDTLSQTNVLLPLERLHKNLLAKGIHLFLKDKQIVGFLEYAFPDGRLWIYSLYVVEAFRKAYGFRFSIISFNALKKIHQQDVYFAAAIDNKTMDVLCKFIKAEPTKSYPLGRIEWRVPWQNS